MSASNSSTRDRVFAGTPPAGGFAFDEAVAAVFDDMISRSVPGYRTVLAMTGALAERHCRPGTAVYDLGCSLGGSTLAVAARLKRAGRSIVAVDSSAAMIDRLRERLAERPGPRCPVRCRREDVMDTVIENASVAVLNFTLQFVPPPRRRRLIERIFEGLAPGGVLILSEKIAFEDPALNARVTERHHRFKEAMGYSRLEISRKRTALENVLVPDTIGAHRRRLEAAGFAPVGVWFQCLNFVSFAAYRP